MIDRSHHHAHAGEESIFYGKNGVDCAVGDDVDVDEESVDVDLGAESDVDADAGSNALVRAELQH